MKGSPIFVVPVRTRRSTFEQDSQVASRPALCPGFKRSSACHHDADDGGSEILTDGECAEGREEGDGIDPHPASTQAVHHGPQRIGGTDGTGHDPQGVALRPGPRQVEHGTDGKARCGDDEERDGNVSLKPRRRGGVCGHHLRNGVRNVRTVPGSNVTGTAGTQVVRP